MNAFLARHIDRPGSSRPPRRDWLAATTRPHTRPPSGPPTGLGWSVVLLALWAAAGCANAPPAREHAYGKLLGKNARSLNGVSVLGRMLEQRGHRVSSWERLSPRLNRADVLIWFPDNFRPPSLAEQAWLEQWLQNTEGTIVYVGRDFDGEVEYWRRMLANAPADQAAEMRRRLAHARASHAARRAAMPENESGRWQRIRRDGPQRQVRSLTSPTDWADGIDPAKLEMSIEGRLEPPGAGAPGPTTVNNPSFGANLELHGDPPEAEVLLSSQGDALVTLLQHRYWGDGQLISVVNGSFLLNLPLVNHEHRKLAERLIKQFERQPELEIVFLESEEALAIRTSEEGVKSPTGMEFLQQWPLAPLSIHLLIALAVGCLALHPIFGRPRETHEEVGGDFSRHVDELGRMLSNTGDVQYARQRLDYYWSGGRRDAAHRDPPKPTN